MLTWESEVAAVNLVQLDTWDADSGAANVVIETIQGSRNKFKYEPERESFTISKILPAGAVFPFDFGFIPSTLGDDGDPLDVLVLIDVPAFPGCRIPCRLVGVLEARQTEEGKTKRNDRLIAVALASHDHRDVHSIKDVNQHLLKEIEHFFISYNEMEGKQFKPLGWHGPKRAKRLAEEGAARFQKKRQPAHDKKAGPNGRARARKGN